MAKRRIRPRPIAAQEPLRGAQVPNQSPDFTVGELVTELRFDVTAPKSPAVSCRQWLRRHAVPVLRRERLLLVERRAIEEALRESQGEL